MEKLKIEYDQQFEVTKEEYKFLMDKFAGIVAGREEGEKFYCKVLLFKYAKHVEIALKNFKK